MSKSSQKPKARKIIDYIAKGKEIFIGLEDSKKTWVICARADKMIVNRFSMPAKYSALRSYLRNNYPECAIHVIYEAGFRGFGLHDDLVGDGYKCTVVPPHTVHQAKCSRVKNDRIDAQLLAKNLEDGNCKACRAPDAELRADRQIVRTLTAVQKEIRRVKNRIRKAFDFHCLETGITVDEWKDRHYRQLRVSFAKLDNPTLITALEPFFEQLEFFWKQEDRLNKVLTKELPQKTRYAKAFKIALSFPGIGELTAIRLILELGEDFERFRSGGEIASFVGLGGTEHSSGNSEKKGSITKQGSALIRSWLIQSSWIAIGRDPALREFFLRVRRNTGQGNKAIVAVSRKLIVRLRSCIVNNVEYVRGVVE